jgi:hypothetical protein
MAGWVVLSNAWTELTVDKLRARLDAIFPGEYLPPRERGNFVIDGAVEGAQFMINCAVAGATGMYMLHSVPGPYTEFSDFADRIDEADLRTLALAQQCWLGIDCYAGAEEDAYRFIGKVLAALAPADAVALVHPDRLTTIRFDDDLRRRLAENGAIELVAESL